MRFVACLLLITALGVNASPSRNAERATESGASTSVRRSKFTTVAPTVEALALSDIWGSVEGVRVRLLGEWLTERAEEERIEAERVAAEELSRQLRTPVQVRISAQTYQGVGECTGFSIPDYIIIRESGGSSTAHNPSGAHGCTQTLLSHYWPGRACADFDPYTIQGQRDCTYVLSNGGTNLAPWAATR